MSSQATRGGLDGKRAVVVGGAGGIGVRTVQRLVQDGARVMVVDRDADAAADLARSLGAAARSWGADAADMQAMSAAFDDVHRAWGGVDIHIHIAGISGRRWGDGPIDTCTEQGWDVVMYNNVRSVYVSNHLATAAMKAQAHGSIVNVSSILGLVGVQEHFVTHAYAAGKGAIVALSRAMAAYYAQHGVRVNCVCPGLLDTPMSQRAINDAEIREWLTQAQPLAPHIGYPDDVAEAIVWLAGDQAAFITGVTLPVDGGWTAQ